MRKFLLALVGMAGLAAAGLILLLAFSNKALNAAVKFAVLGEIPGTHTQLDFTSSVISGLTLLVVCFGFAIIYHRVSGNEYPAFFDTLNAAGNDESTEPFDGEDIIMVARELPDESVSRHESLPVQLQLFEQEYFL